MPQARRTEQIVFDVSHHYSILLALASQARAHMEILVKLAKGTLPWGMAGYCGVGSRHLQSLAKSAGIDIDLVYGRYSSKRHSSGHCWTEYQNKVIDVTATQFFRDHIDAPIYLFDKGFDKRYIPLYRNELADEVIRCWTREQNYYCYRDALTTITRLYGLSLIRAITEQRV